MIRPPHLPLPLFFVLAALPVAVAAMVSAAQTGGQGDEPGELAAVPGSVRQAMLHGRYDQALEVLAGLKTSRAEDADMWIYLEGLAHEQAGRLQEALGRLEELERAHADSRLRMKGRFHRAEILRRLGRMQEAEDLVEQAARRLRSAGRRTELAEIYLELGDRYSIEPEGPRPKSIGLDYERALNLYAQVFDLDVPTDVQVRARESMARCQEKLGRWDQAAQELQRILDLGIEGAEREGVRYRRAVALLEAGQHARARRELEDQLRDLTAEGAEADAELVGDVRFAIARAWHGNSVWEKSLGVAAYRRFLEAHPAHPRAAQAAFRVAELLAESGEREESIGAYDAFRGRSQPTVTDEEKREEVLAEFERMRAEALYRIGSLNFDLARYEEASGKWREYVATYSSGARWNEAQSGIPRCARMRGDARLDEDDFAGAREAWNQFLADWPLDGQVQEIHFRLAELNEKEAAQVKEDGADPLPLFRQAVQAYGDLNRRFPASNVASHALFRQGLILEVHLDDLTAAIEAYRACNFGSHQAQAAARLAAMLEPNLELLTERTWRNSEKAKVKVTTRNHPKLIVSVYTLDLEAYFRKHLTHRQVEDLDLDLIQPDESFEVEPEDYAKYALHEQQIELPVEGPGVWAVSVRGDEQRATTLVVRSDVDVVVKSSRRELFVFAEDMPAGAPAPGVDVLVALPGMGEDGAPVLHELQTDAEGIARLLTDDLKDSTQVRLFASREGHCASNGLSLNGLVRSAGLSPRGFVYTDRTAYRPGERVNWRAILRGVKDGSYHFDADTECRVELLDPAGRLARREVLALSEFGTLSGDLELVEDAPLGRWSVSCVLPQVGEMTGGTFTGTFEVLRYQLNKVELTLETEQSVYYRGDEVEVTARAQWYYGSPLVDARMLYTLPDGRQLETRTDSEGVAKFTLETRDAQSEGILRFHANLPDEGAQASGQVVLAIRAYRASLKTPGRVVLAGNSFPVTLETKSPDGEPVSETMTLRVLKRVTRRGRTIEEEVESRELTTGEDGEARTTLALADGGSYTLRVEGLDRFGNPVQASATQFISGEDDEVKLRWITERAKVQVGEAFELTLVNRAEAGLALLTIEGETILGHRLIQLTTGENKVTFTVEGDHFPNVSLSLSLMQGNQFHESHVGFAVARELRVSIELEKEQYAPGEKAQVNLVVTDQNGDPVRAELSLAVVDDSLFDLYPDRLPGLVPHFMGTIQRQAELRTATSCTFRYQATTGQVSEAVLEEALRVAANEAWDEARSVLTDRLAQVEAESALEPVAASREVLRGADMDFELSLGYRAESGEMDALLQDQQFNDVIGIGGGAGGAFGGRYAGRRQTAARGGLAGPATPGPQRRLRGKKSLNKFAEIREDAPAEEADDKGPDGTTLDGDTLFWTPSVVTGDDGKASLEFTFPARSTRWRLTSRGVDTSTLVGDARIKVRSRADFFVELRTPYVMTQGDRPRLMARVHNLTGKTGSGNLSLVAKSDEHEQRFSLPLSFGEDPLVEVVTEALSGFEGIYAISVDAVAEATLDGAQMRDEAREFIAVEPWGVAFSATASGRLENEETRFLALPENRGFGARSLELYVGPSVSRLLLDEALGLIPRFYSSRIAPPQNPASRATDLIGVCAVLESMRTAGFGEQPEVRRLIERAEGQLTSLAATQRADGGWSWHGGDGTSRLEVTSRVTLALARARGVALSPADEVVERAAEYLRQTGRGLGRADTEQRAMVQYALSAVGQGDFAALNRLHRERVNLSPAALAYTALALCEEERVPMAADLATLLETQALTTPAPRRGCRWPVHKNIGWNRSELEMVALATHALQRSLPASAKVREGLDYLLAHRPWTFDRARGLAIEAVAWFEREIGPAADKVRVSVQVADLEPQLIELAAGEPGKSFEMDLAQFAEREVRVQLSLEGRGTPSFTAVLTGFTSDLEPREGERRRLGADRQRFESAAPRYLGREVPTGFSVVTDFDEEWNNTVSNLEFGHTTRVHLRWWRERETLDGQHLLLDLPLPAGATILDGSFSGGLGGFEQRLGRLMVPLPPTGRSGDVYVTLVGAHPGTYRVLPPTVRSATDPSIMGLGEIMNLAVLAPGEESPDDYRPTPDELFHLGKAQHEAKDFEASWTNLSGLWNEYESKLRERPLKEAANLLLLLSIDRKDASAVVNFFEVLKEKDPEVVVPFDKVVAVGEAYRTLGEYERALLIFRATILETFGTDLKVAGTLEGLGEFARSVSTLEELWLAYPDSAAVVATYLTLADKILEKAPDAWQDKSLRDAGLGRATLTEMGVRHLHRFLAFYGTDPMAADAALNLVSAHLDLEDYERAADLAGDFASRFQEPRYADAFQYTQAVAKWYLGEDSEAERLLERIAAAEYAGDDGAKIRSENRDLALYILGQIHHARQEPEKASEYYEEVDHLFADAKEALTSFREKQISMEEVTSVRPGEAVELELTYRNLKEAELLVYQVDLMTLYLREKNLSNITEVNLAGITPALRTRVPLGEGTDLRPQTSSATLALADPGAYLVLCRGEERFASGLVLVSEIDIEVKEDAGTGRMRVQALDSDDGRFLREVDVRVIGSADQQFQSGTTDPRGLYLADGVRGTSTVIARHDGEHYAFFRGETLLAQAQQLPQQENAARDSRGIQLDPQDKAYFKNVRGFNRLNIDERQQQFQQELSRKRTGVQVQQVK